MSNTPKPDLTTTNGVLAYLRDTPFASDRVARLSGGNANFIFRLHLLAPFEGQDTLVLKHAESYLPTAPDFAFDVIRQDYEVEALRRVHAWVPSDAVVTVPAVYHFDRDVNAIIMEDAGEGTTTLKELLIDRPPSPALAATIGTVLGEFWGRLHSWGTSNPDLLKFFTRYTYARTICAYITYGRLVDTLTGQSALPALDDPPLGVPAAKLHAIRELCVLRTAQMEAARQTFVQGDFWPGNLLVRLAPGGGALERIFVVDWEVARPGLAGVEVGQFCAELATVRRFHPPSGEAAARVLETFLASYFGGLAQLDHAETARVALGHFGAHLVAWTPRVPWDGVEKTRAAVMDGVDFLVESYSGKESLSEGGLIDRFLR